MSRLDELEAQSIFIFREAFARLRRTALLWSLGKGSNVMIWIIVSIGWAPCARAIAPGEPERAGRWWWEGDDKKECGLHTRNEKMSAVGHRS